MSDAIEHTPVATEPSAGARLAAARQAQSMSVADVARQLRLSPRQVEALEAGEFGKLPGAVFVRGFIRNYARLLKLDAGPLLRDAVRQYPPQPAAEVAPPSTEIPFPSGRTRVWPRYFDAPPATVTVRPNAVLVVPSAAQVAVPAPQSDAMPGAAAPVAAADEVEPGVMPGAVPPVEVASETAVPRPGEHRVRLVFEKESWVEIRDRSGRKIFSGLNAAGTEQVVNGAPPLSVVVGNAGGVKLAYDDQPVDLARHTKVDVARLTLE
ncbi:MAG: helix-turn-helix domain-containing protein [Betaproteobacteria bacterium]|nr:helix-turn-helix domain-containing protein [Betaproteobacteria bacterium]